MVDPDGSARLPGPSDWWTLMIRYDSQILMVDTDESV